MRGRFNHTLREVVQQDYMPQIGQLQHRLEKLEGKLSHAGSYQSTYVTDANNSRLNELLERMSSLRHETNNRVQEMNNQLHAILEQNLEVSEYVWGGNSLNN